MQPLVDGDVIRYEVGYAAEASWSEAGFPPFDYVAEILDQRISDICFQAGGTMSPILFLTGKTNFRNEIAKRRKYKDRSGLKPWHFNNITAYMNCMYNVDLSEGMEADDRMAIEQTRREEILNGNPFYSGPTIPSIICTRDKDLRQVPGWHYGWELGKQPSYGPKLVDEVGEIWLSPDRKKILGHGMMFFYAQCLTGDSVDSVPGIDKMGPVGAFKILEGSVGLEDAFKRVREAYRASYGENGDEELLEQGRLLWMTRKLDENGKPILWEFPNG